MQSKAGMCQCGQAMNVRANESRVELVRTLPSAAEYERR